MEAEVIPMKETDSAKGQVRSVAKAMELIGMLLRARRPMSLQELSNESGCPKSTVHGLLSTLRAYDMIRQGEDGRYDLGIRLYECGCAVAAHWDIKQAARPWLEQLAQELGTGTVLAMRSGNQALCIDRCAAGTGSGPQVTVEEGIRLPLHATAPGKLLLAGLSEAEFRRYLREVGLVPFTRHTLTQAEALAGELARIRAAGWAVEDGEYRVGLRAAAAPVYEADGIPRYTLGAMGLFPRVQSEEFQYAVARTRAAAAALSAALGYRG